MSFTLFYNVSYIMSYENDALQHIQVKHHVSFCKGIFETKICLLFVSVWSKLFSET